jgi:predicted dithiol-disulfide oxidoreductase (DUF899 family)
MPKLQRRSLPAHVQTLWPLTPGLLGGERSTEMPGHSCFLRDGNAIFHTYSTYGRGNDYTPSLYTLLDLTALGRQEAWEEPKGRAPVLHDTEQGRGKPTD